MLRKEMYSTLIHFRSVVTSVIGWLVLFNLWDIHVFSLCIEEKPIFFNRKKPLVVKEKKLAFPLTQWVVGWQVKKKVTRLNGLNRYIQKNFP
jgi:hypothetical protein